MVPICPFCKYFGVRTCINGLFEGSVFATVKNVLYAVE